MLYFSHPASPAWPPDFRICELPTQEDEPIPSAVLRQGVAFIRDGLAAGEPVLVVCSQGISRAPGLVMAYLVESGTDLRDAWELVQRRYPMAWPQPAMWQSLLTHYQLPYTLDDVAQWLERSDVSR
jgi:protein-tyrosine phosphatase